MDKSQAIKAFWAGFGLPAFDRTTVPDNAIDTYGAYITYNVVKSAFDAPVPMSADIWYRDPSWASIEAKAEEIARVIGRGGVKIRCDGGGIWIVRERNFMERIEDADDMVRRMHINVIVEYITEV